MVLIKSKQRLTNLLLNLSLLPALGEPITIQIDLNDTSGLEEDLLAVFNDSRLFGFYVNNTVVIQHSTTDINYALILDKLMEILIDDSVIDSVTALISIPLKSGEYIESSIQIDASLTPPKILAAADSSLYFELAQTLQMRWSMARSRVSSIA